MVYTEFSVRRAISRLIFTCLIVSFSSQASTSDIDQSNDVELDKVLPIFIAELSQETHGSCLSRECDVNPLTSQMLQSIFKQHPLYDEVLNAFGLSEYELLTSSAIVPSGLGHNELILEMTTSWRGVPVDEFTIKAAVNESMLDVASQQINQWVKHAVENDTFGAQKIYAEIGASDYFSNMQLPEKIGDFVFMETALYHDPMLGSISRYTHPEYSDAIVDVSVYPVSPFVQAYKEAKHPITAEMEIEKNNIKELIALANIDDYEISEIRSMYLESTLGEIEALSMEVALQASFDPIYSTQLLFTLNDKFVKVTGTLPKEMMLALVRDSIDNIAVPDESAFMQSMRQL